MLRDRHGSAARAVQAGAQRDDLLEALGPGRSDSPAPPDGMRSGGCLLILPCVCVDTQTPSVAGAGIRRLGFAALAAAPIRALGPLRGPQVRT